MTFKDLRTPTDTNARFLRARWMLAARVTLTGLVLGYVYHRVQWEPILQALHGIQPTYLAAALSVQGMAALLAATRWWILLRGQRIRIAWTTAARITLVGIFFNFFLLGSIGGDTARFASVLRHDAPSKTRAALTLVQDRLFGLGALLLLLCAVFPLYYTLVTSNRTLDVLALVVVAGTAAFLLAAGLLWTLGPTSDGAMTNLQTGNGARILDTLRTVFPRNQFFTALGLSLLIHSASITAAWASAHAIGLGLPWTATALVFEATALALSVPVTVAGLGVRDGMLVWLLGSLSWADPISSLKFSACLLGIGLIWAMIGCIAFYLPAKPALDTP